MSTDEGVGGRVATLRKARGLSQRELAARANVSYSLLTKVESGHVPATTAFTSSAARALSIEVRQLTGQPYASNGDPNQRSTRAHAAIPEIRRILPSFEVPPEEGIAARDLDELAQDVAKVNECRRLGKYEQLAITVPSLLADVAHARKLAEGPDRDKATYLLAAVLRSVNTLAHHLGYVDLSNMAVERFHILAYLATGSNSTDLLPAVSSHVRTGVLMANGTFRDGARLIDAEIANLEPHTADQQKPSDRLLSVYGALHIRAADNASRIGNAQAANDHIQEARETAARLSPTLDPYRTDYYQLGFAPSNVALLDVAVSVALGRPGDALSRAKTVDAQAKSSLPAERASHHELDLARAHMVDANYKAALAHLVEARRICPQFAKYHPQVREILHTLNARERRTSGTLREFTHWVGLD